jgi:arsenate reductase
LVSIFALVTTGARRSLEAPKTRGRAMTKSRVLFLRTHKSARSHMAEGSLRHLAGDRFEVISAGREATSVRPEAVAAMAELGVGISGQESKTLERYLGEPFDYVVTVCDDANEACPLILGAERRLHWSFRVPSRATGGEKERLKVLRTVRDEILTRINDELLSSLTGATGDVSSHRTRVPGGALPQILALF